MKTRIDMVSNWRQMARHLSGELLTVEVIWQSGNEDLIEIDFGSYKEWVWRVCDGGGDRQWEEVWLKCPKEFLREKKIEDLLK